MREARIVVVGAGIGGLVFGIAMQQRGIGVHLYEQAAELDEVGAGVALWSNATRLLHRLGLADALAANSAEPTQVIFRNGVDGSRIVGFPLAENHWYRRQFGAPYYGIHRKTLQRILVDALGPASIQLDHRLVGIEEVDGGVTRLHWATGAHTDADVVIGADGIRSVVRDWMVDGLDHAMYSRTSGFRGVVPLDALEHLPDPTATQFWVGDGAHLLHFPMAPNYKYATFLAVEEDPKVWPNPNAWRVGCTPEEALASFDGWHPAVSEMIAAAGPTERWGLFGIGPLTSWARNHVALLGDAAHGLLPHHGQGANQCVEDAVILADLLTADDSLSIAEKLQRYSDIRIDRAQRVQKISWVSNRLFHLPDGPEIRLRDDTFRNLYHNVRWIHEYDAQAETGIAVPSWV